MFVLNGKGLGVLALGHHDELESGPFSSGQNNVEGYTSGYFVVSLGGEMRRELNQKQHLVSGVFGISETLRPTC